MKKSDIIEQHCGYGSNPTLMRLLPNGDLVPLVNFDNGVTAISGTKKSRMAKISLVGA